MQQSKNRVTYKMSITSLAKAFNNVYIHLLRVLACVCSQFDYGVNASLLRQIDHQRLYCEFLLAARHCMTKSD